ncbi:helix-turn-helix domain-containing protein [uncultured Kordia sp.]|uniref:helix-turn-helix domain-containing protein n=1 Tax=uncultured Kordia sp. TaxID=507699 RepID=UPI002638FCF4|nr:helix-turn-helix domain-containing protein [uncultured Kordia sp.]
MYQTYTSIFPRIRFSIYIILFCFAVQLHAQTDSLQGKSYEELIQFYNDVLFKDSKKAKEYALAANKLAKEKNNKNEIGWSTYYIANANSLIPVYDEALDGAEKSILIAKNLNDNELLFKNYNLKGNVLSETDNDIEAINQYDIAKEYALLTNNILDKITVAVNIAFIKKNNKNHSQAITIFQENWELLKQIENSNPKKNTYERIILFNIADTYLRIKKPKEAQDYNNLALQKCSKVEFPSFYHTLTLNDAIIQYQLKNYEKAISISKEAEKYFLSINNKDRLVTPYFYLGKSYYQLQKYADAIEFMNKANQIVSERKIAFPDQIEAYELLYKCYTKIGKPKDAEINFDLFSKLNKKVDSVNMKVINKIHEDYDIASLEEEIDSLGKYTKYLYGASAILLLSLIGFFVWFKRKQQQNKTSFQELLLTIEKLEQPKEKIIPAVIVKETTNPVTDENAVQILKALEAFEEKELYLRQDCTLAYVAKKVKTNTSYLSNVINTYKEKSFKSYLSELRINAALIKLKNDDKLRSYTIKAIAEEFGFKRSETFSRAFKAQTGMYPSYYIKSLQNQKDT